MPCIFDQGRILCRENRTKSGSVVAREPNDAGNAFRSDGLPELRAYFIHWAMPRSVTTKVDYPVNAPATRLFGPAVTPTPATLIIADDHPLFRAALREAIGRLLPGTRIIEAGSLASLEEAVQANPSADLVLLDLRMPGARGFSALIQLRAQYPSVP